MAIPQTVTQLLVLLILVLPGFVFQLVSIRLRGITPPEHEFATRLISAIGLSALFALAYVVMLELWPESWIGLSVPEANGDVGNDVLADPLWYAVQAGLMAFVVPALCAYLIAWMKTTGLVTKLVAKLVTNWSSTDPRPTAWDRAFSGMAPQFVRVQMRDGAWYAGWYGTSSYASSWPDPPSLFVEVSMEVDSAGKIGLPVQSSGGAVIDCRDAVLVEFLAAGDVTAEVEPQAGRSPGVWLVLAAGLLWGAFSRARKLGKGASEQLPNGAQYGEGGTHDGTD